MLNFIESFNSFIFSLGPFLFLIGFFLIEGIGTSALVRGRKMADMKMMFMGTLILGIMCFITLWIGIRIDSQVYAVLFFLALPWALCGTAYFVWATWRMQG